MVVTWLLGKDRVQVLMCGGKCLAKTGVKVGTEFLLNTTVSGNQRYPEIQFYPDGTFVAGFVDASQTVLQRFTADGRPIGLETRISSGTGTTTLSVAPTTGIASDIVTVSMTLTNPTTLNNAKPCPLTVYGTNGVFATLVSSPVPSSTTVGSSGTTFTWTYRVTAADQTGVLTFGGNAYNTTGSIFPFNTSNTITVKSSIYLCDMTSPNLVNDSNNPDQSPNVFTIGAKIINPSLNSLTNVVVYIGNGTTAGVFPTTTMSLSQTNNTYQGTFVLSPLAGVGDGTRTIGTMGAAKSVIGGGIDFNGDGVLNTSDDGLLSNGKTVIDGRIDVDKNGSISTIDDFSYPAGVFTGY